MKKLQQVRKQMDGKYQQTLEDQRAYQMALIAEREKQQQALAEQLALKEAQDKHQQALEEERNKSRLALIAEQERHRQTLAEERSRHEQALTDMKNRHQQVLRQKERELNEYATRLNTLSLQFAELNGTIAKSDTRLKLTIKELTDAFDSKRSEHARALADLQSSTKMLDETRAALAASRDVGERQANKLKEIEARHRELQADVGRKEAAIDNLNALLVDRDQQIQAVMTQIEALYASRSWRMTRPFRVAKRFFFRLRNLPSSNR